MRREPEYPRIGGTREKHFTLAPSVYKSAAATFITSFIFVISTKSDEKTKKKILIKQKQFELKERKMSGSDTAMYNQAYKNIERPYANVDLSKIPSWELVMSIMEQQAHEARRHIMAKYHAQSEQLMPQTITNYHEYHSTPYNYGHTGNSTEESDNSSCCSDEMMTSSTPSSSPDVSQSESDIEIDVDSIEEENDDYFMSSHDNIPITVLQLETKLREKELKQS